MRVRSSKSVLLTGFGLVLVLMLSVAVIGFYRMNANYAQTESVFATQYEYTSLLTRMRNIARERIVTLFEITDATDFFEQDDHIQYFRELASQFLVTREQVEAIEMSPRQRAAYRNAMDLVNIASREQNVVIDMIDDKNVSGAKQHLVSVAVPAQDGLMVAYDDMLDRLGADAMQALEAGRRNNDLTLALMLGLVLVGTILAAVVAAVVIRRITFTENALHDEKQQALVTLASIGDGVIRTDVRNRVMFMNARAESMLGRESAAVSGLPLPEIVSLPEPSANTAARHAGPTVGEVSSDASAIPQFELRANDGKTLWVETSVSGVRNVEGESTGDVLVMRDVTETRNAERRLRELNATLETRVRERTEALVHANQELQATIEDLRAAQSQLVQAEKMASLGNLVAGISHEINTPLGIGVTCVSGLHEQLGDLRQKFESEALRRSELVQFVERSDQACEILQQNLNRASTLVSSFKQVAVDQSDDAWRTINLHNYCDKILTSLGPRLKRRPISVENRCETELEFPTDPGAIYQIISNLVINSLTHGFDEGQEGTIRLSATRQNGMVRLEYSDDGKGIDADHLARIFDPFFTTRRGQGGSGLGLHIVYNLVTTTLRGTISAESSPGEGARFIISFPVTEEEQAA